MEKNKVMFDMTLPCEVEASRIIGLKIKRNGEVVGKVVSSSEPDKSGKATCVAEIYDDEIYMDILRDATSKFKPLADDI